MSSRTFAWLTMLLGVAVSVALACGPDFPHPLTTDREKQLKRAPWNSFRIEATRLVAKPSDGLKPAEDAVHHREEGLSGEQKERVERMRVASDGDTAFVLGEDLPIDVRLYTVGAVEFRRGDFSAAAARFREVLAAPGAEAGLRTTWASYMIGRINAKTGSFRRAERAFAATRRLARSGAPDPLGLAVSSYGEQARLHLDRAKALVSGVKESDPLAPASFGRAVAAAVRLYGRQAAHGSESGVNSLRRIAIWLANDEALLTASVDWTVTQRLMAAYFVVRLDQLASSIRDYDSASDRDDLVSQEKLLPTLVRAIERTASGDVERADVLAALCYRSGEYELAKRLALKSQGPLGAWVRAKLALLHGDRKAAADFYAEAVKGWSGPGFGGAPEQVRALQGEAAILALSRRLYLDALRDMDAAGLD